MSPTIEEQIDRLRSTIAEMEAQRESLGDSVVHRAIYPLREKLEELNRLLAVSRPGLSAKPMQQRKLVTLLFMDIAGSTSIAQYMDPEDVGEVFDITLRRLAEPIEQYGGRVTRFMGDGFLSVFGAPTAHEDDPEQAVRAGLKVIELSSELAARLQIEWNIPDFQVRVGVNTGLVLLGGETEAEDTLMGSAVNLAARLQSAAPPGGLLVSHDTYRHIRGIFDVEPWEPILVKGFDDPVQVYRILRARPRAFRTYSRGVEGVETRMVGREAELKHMQDALLTVIEENTGQIVTITGEAGVGKSRLLYEFQNWIELLPQHVRFFEGRGRSEAQGLPYALLRDLFATRFQIKDEDRGEVARGKIEAGFGEVLDAYPDKEMRAHILGQLLGFDFSASPHLKPVLGIAEQLRNRGLMYLWEYFKALCVHGPVVVLLEDIHWADDSSLDALIWLGERMHNLSLIFACTARDTFFERRPDWGEGLPYHRRITLEPLSLGESRQLVAEILKFADQVPPELSLKVIEGAEGNPFYLEELIKMLVEDGVIVKGEETWQVHLERLSEIQVPPTLAGVLQARLDSLPPEERAVLQQASVVGRQFWDRVVAFIQAAEGGKSQVVPEALTSLRSREMIYHQEPSAFIDAREYLFKHDILREVTYELVLKRLRRVYHGMVADWLIDQVAERAGEYSGLIARHLLLAGRRDLAGEYFLKAGQASLASYANREAEDYFRQALEISTSDSHRADCLAGLGEALYLQGSLEESIQMLRQGINLYLKLEESGAAADLYARLSLVTWSNNRQSGLEVCQEGLRRLEGAPESPGLACLLAQAGRFSYLQDRPADEVKSLCQQAMEMAQRVGELDAIANSMITLALNTLALATSDDDEAIKLMQEAAEFSEAHGLWYQAGRAYSNLAVLKKEFMQDVKSAHQLYLKSIELSIKIGDTEGVIAYLVPFAWHLIYQGYLKSGEEQIAEILRRSNAPKNRIDEILNEVHAFFLYRRGEWTQALESLREIMEKYRKGRGWSFNLFSFEIIQTYLDLDRFLGAADLREAEKVVRLNMEAGAPRITCSWLLAILFSRQGRFADAREKLAEVYNEIGNPIDINYNLLYAEVELDMSEGHWEEAIPKIQKQIDYYRRIGDRWPVAYILIKLGDALLGRDAPGDREQAQEAYRQSLEMFTEMGAPGYIQVLEERLGRL